MIRRSLALVMLAFAPVLLAVPAARAQTCSVAMDTIDFGTLDTAAGRQATAVGMLTATCTGEPGQRVRLCPRFGAGSGGSLGGQRTMKGETGGTTIPYALARYPDGERWELDLWRGTRRTAVLDVALGNNGTGSGTLAIGAVIEASLTMLPAGSYSSVVAGEDAVVTYGYATGGCAQQGRLLSTSAPFSVRATIAPSCTVSTTSLEFGRLSSLDVATDSVGTILFQCTAGTRYEAALDTTNAVSGDPTRRRMRAGPDVMLYGTYRDPGRSLPWGNVAGRDTQPGIGDGRPQVFQVYGRIQPQIGIKPGRYIDTIVVSISY